MSSETKKLKTANSSDIEEFNINNLVEDCLINIFEYLTVDEKLMIESVCKKWEDIGKRSWSNVTSLTIDVKATDANKFSEKLKYFIRIIKRCGLYLKNLTVINYDDDYSILFQELLKKSQNITNLLIDGRDFSDEKNLELLFKNNQKLSSVIIKNTIFFNGHFLTNLNAAAITELHLVCHFESVPRFDNFFSKLKNIQIIQINLSKGSTNDIIIGLNDSNCENIHDFYLVAHFNEYTNKLTSLLSRQKNLRQLNLLQLSIFDIGLKSNFWKSLGDCPVEELTTKMDEETSHSLHGFKNLTDLTCWIDNLSNARVIQNLTRYTNLKKLTFYFHLERDFEYNLSSEFENSFVDFKNIESFTFNIFPVCIDGFLNALEKNNSESIKELDIMNSLFADESGLKNILSFKNLKVLKIRIYYENNKKLMFVINKLSKLERVDINTDQSLNYPFFKKINDAKIKRNDKHILQINIGDRAWNDSYDNFNNEFGLISIINTSFLI